MNNVFNEVSVAGIIEPGQLYIFDDGAHRGWSPEPIEYLFCIREDKEILPALDMVYCIILAEDYELIEFLAARKLNKNCHEFKVLLNEKDSGKKVKRSLYLHRIQTFNEYLARTKRLFRRK